VSKSSGWFTSTPPGAPRPPTSLVDCEHRKSFSTESGMFATDALNRRNQELGYLASPTPAKRACRGLLPNCQRLHESGCGSITCAPALSSLFRCRRAHPVPRISQHLVINLSSSPPSVGSANGSVYRRSWSMIPPTVSGRAVFSNNGCFPATRARLAGTVGGFDRAGARGVIMATSLCAEVGVVGIVAIQAG